MRFLIAFLLCFLAVPTVLCSPMTWDEYADDDWGEHHHKGESDIPTYDYESEAEAEAEEEAMEYECPENEASESESESEEPEPESEAVEEDESEVGEEEDIEPEPAPAPEPAEEPEIPPTPEPETPGPNPREPPTPVTPGPNPPEVPTPPVQPPPPETPQPPQEEPTPTPSPPSTPAPPPPVDPPTPNSRPDPTPPTAEPNVDPSLRADAEAFARELVARGDDVNAEIANQRANNKRASGANWDITKEFELLPGITFRSNGLTFEVSGQFTTDTGIPATDKATFIEQLVKAIEAVIEKYDLKINEEYPRVDVEALVFRTDLKKRSVPYSAIVAFTPMAAEDEEGASNTVQPSTLAALGVVVGAYQVARNY